MKKALSVFLSLVMVITTISVALVFPAAATDGTEQTSTPTYTFDEDFENYEVSASPLAGATIFKSGVGDANNVVDSVPNEKGWLKNYTNAETDVIAQEDGGNKYLSSPAWNGFYKLATVKPNTEYTMFLRVKAAQATLGGFAVYDYTNVTTIDSTTGKVMYPVRRAASVTGTVANDMAAIGCAALYPTTTFQTAASTWKDIVISFTTGANTTLISLQYLYTSGGNPVCFDDFELKETNYVLDENFEAYTEGVNPLADSTQSGATASVPGGNWWAYPNREGWYSGPVTGIANVADVSIATTTGDNDTDKALYAVAWRTFGRLATVEPNTDYVLRFKNKVNSTISFQYQVLDITGSDYAPFYNGGTLNASVWTNLVATKTSTTVADTWATIEVPFTTGANTTKIAVNFISDNRTGYLDNIELVKAKDFTLDDNFESYELGENVTDGSVKYTNNYLSFMGSANAHGYIIGQNSPDIAVATEENGNKYLSLAAWNHFFKVFKVKPSTSYAINFEHIHGMNTYSGNYYVYDGTDANGNILAKFPTYENNNSANHEFSQSTYYDVDTYITGAQAISGAGSVWKDASLKFTTGEKTTYAVFGFIGGDGTAGFDNFELIENPTYTLDEDFEDYNVGDNPLTGSVQAWISATGYDYAGYPNHEGWASGSLDNKLVNVVDITVQDLNGDKALYAADWMRFSKLVTVKPNTDYILRFKHQTVSTSSFKFSVYDATGKNHAIGRTTDTSLLPTLITPNTQLTGLTANAWNNIELNFKTDEDTTQIDLTFYSDNIAGGYIDDIILLERDYNFSSVDFENYEVGETVRGDQDSKLNWHSVLGGGGYLSTPNSYGFSKSYGNNLISLTAAQVAKDGKDDNKALKVVDTNGSMSFGLTMNAEPSTVYELSFKYKTEAGNTLGLIWVSDTTNVTDGRFTFSHDVNASLTNAGNYISAEPYIGKLLAKKYADTEALTTSNGEWTEVTLKFSTNATTKNITFFNDTNKNTASDAAVYYDDFKLVKSSYANEEDFEGYNAGESLGNSSDMMYYLSAEGRWITYTNLDGFVRAHRDMNLFVSSDIAKNGEANKSLKVTDPSTSFGKLFNVKANQTYELSFSYYTADANGLGTLHIVDTTNMNNEYNWTPNSVANSVANSFGIGANGTILTSTKQKTAEGTTQGAWTEVKLLFTTNDTTKIVGMFNDAGAKDENASSRVVYYDDFKLVEVADKAVYLNDAFDTNLSRGGAAIRVSRTDENGNEVTKQALRFKSTISKELLGNLAIANAYTVVEYGSLAMRTEFIAEGDELTIGYTNEVDGATKSVSKGVTYNIKNGTNRVFSQDETTVTFTAALTGIAKTEAGYHKDYTVRAYAILEDAKGNQVTVYDEPIETERTSANVYEIAELAYADETVLDAVKDALFKDVLNIANKTKYNSFNTSFNEYEDGEQILNGAAQTVVSGTYYVAPNANGWVHGANMTENANVFVKKLEDGNSVLSFIKDYQHVGRVLDVKPNTTYTITFKAKVDAQHMRVGQWGVMNATGLEEVMVAGTLYSDTASYITPKQGTYVSAADTNWHEYSISFTTTTDMTKAYFTFNGDALGTINEVYFDDFKVVENEIEFNEDFEDYTVGNVVTTGCTVISSHSTANANGFVQGSANAFTVAEEDGNKYLACADWKDISKLAKVEANTEYVISFRIRTASTIIKNIAIVDVTGKTMFPQSCSVATSDGLTYLSDAKSYTTSAGKWETLTIKFKTGENTELIQFIYDDQGGNTSVHYDDFVITKK